MRETERERGREIERDTERGGDRHTAYNIIVYFSPLLDAREMTD